MVASETFAEFLREQLARLGPISFRRMFGKTGVFCDGLMFGVVAENTLYFRVDDDNRQAFKEAEAWPPLNYSKQGATIDLSFWRAPERLFDEGDELIAWARGPLCPCRGPRNALVLPSVPLRGQSSGNGAFTINRIRTEKALLITKPI